MPDSQEVKNMFKNVAKRYDFINSLLSFGFDRNWRRVFTLEILKRRPTKIIDVATGSGRVAFEIIKIARKMCLATEVIGYDFCEPLLELGRKEAKKKNLEQQLHFENADALALPCSNACAQAVCVAFGLRNFSDRKKFYSEAQRILLPGGALYILEFSQPVELMKPFFHIYQRAIPYLAWLCGAPKSAYQYLNSSINAFPSAPELSKELLSSGFRTVTYKCLMGGIVAIHTALL